MKDFRKLILLCSLSVIVLLSGCNDKENGVVEIEYKDDIITIEDFYISDRKPYENAVTMIDFLVKNNGEFPVDRVEIGFDAPGFYIDSLVCEGTTPFPKESGDDNNTCVFDKLSSMSVIEPLDTRTVTIALKVRNIGLLHPQTYTMTFYVEYDYFGFRKMDIPIIDGETRKKPLSKYGQSSQTYGPIHLDFKPPVRGEKVEEGKTVKEHWGVRDQPFKVEMEFKHVGRSSIGAITDPKIEKGKVRLDLRDSLERGSVGGLDLPCEFCEMGDPDCVAPMSGYLFSNKSLEIPDELSCNFQARGFSGPEMTATIWAEYNYTYIYTNSQDFEIQPLTG
jgi:hypothetical protein